MDVEVEGYMWCPTETKILAKLKRLKILEKGLWWRAEVQRRLAIESHTLDLRGCWAGAWKGQTHKVSRAAPWFWGRAFGPSCAPISGICNDQLTNFFYISWCLQSLQAPYELLLSALPLALLLPANTLPLLFWAHSILSQICWWYPGPLEGSSQ